MYRKSGISKTCALLICGILSVSLLTGCGKKAVTEPAENVQETASNEKEAAAADEVKAADNAEQGDFAETPAEEEQVETAGMESEEVMIVNNNGHFVQIGDKIYFHVADADSMGRTALWAQYSDTECGRTVLFEYDPSEDEAKAVCYDYTSGGLSVQGDSLYATSYSTPIDQSYDPGLVETAIGAYCYTDNKTDIIPCDNDFLLGAGSDNSYIAVMHYGTVDGESVKQISIYRDGAVRKSFNVNGYCNYVKLGDNEIFYICGDSDTGFSLRQIDVNTGEILNLGDFPSFRDTQWYGTVDECILDGDNIYFTYSDYEGTGHFFAQGYYVQARAGRAGSLTYKDMPEKTNYEEMVVCNFAVVNGEMKAADGEPGTCKVLDNGDLGYYDEQGSWVKVADGWESKFLTDEGDYKGVELAEKVGDYIYLIYNGNARAPEDDIGWRYAYYRNYTNVCRISVETGESIRLVRQVAPWD